MKHSLFLATVGVALFPCIPLAIADTHTTGVPALSSRPGGAYTLYLDFAGFNYTGTWSSYTPGSIAALNNRTGTFNSTDQNTISAYFARVANHYSPFDVNVTTIDPAIAAGQADTDAHRQAYYDLQARMMHQVIGSESFISGYGGISFINTTPYSYNPSGSNGGAGWGAHTNWVNTDGVGTGQAAGEAGAHENGHGFNLWHQSDYTGTTKINEYSTNNHVTGNGSYAPIMGASYYSQRGAWRLGDATRSGTQQFIQNDVQILANDPGMNGFLDTGVGHTRLSASVLPLTGSNVDYTSAKGIIVPASVANPTPIGANNYTTDFWSFASDGIQSITLTVNDGNQLLTPGVADPGAMLRSTLTIFDNSGAQVATATEALNTLSETYSGILPAGTYFAQVASFGGYTSPSTPYNAEQYFDMGSYFLTGSGFVAIPEPLGLMTIALTGLLLLRRTKRQTRQ